MKIVVALVGAIGLLLSTLRQEPTPVATLEVKIVDVEAVSKHFPGSLVTLEVKNQGATWVEPLAFEITTKGKDDAPIAAVRVLPPVYGRAGRVIAPKKKERFVVQVRQSPPDLSGAKALVSLATVHTTETLGHAAKDVVDVGKKRVDEYFDAVRNERLPRTIVPLSNQLDSPIDVTLRVEIEGRFPCSALVRTRLAANEEVDFAIAEVLFATDDRGGGGGPIGVDAKSVELVDWSVVVDDGAALARAELERAWKSWARITPEKFPMRAPFRAHVVLIGLFGNLGERFDVDEQLLGTIVVEANGDFALLDEAGKRLVGGVERNLRDSVGPAVLHMARPTLEEALAPCKLSLLSSGDEVRIAIEGNERVFGAPLADVAVADGRITSTGWIDAGSLGRHIWSSRTEPDGRWRMDESFCASDSQGDERRTLRFGDQGVLVRVEHTTEGTLLQNPTSIVVRFGKWSSNAESAAAAEPAPTGELADRLRAAWDAFHRHPDPEATIHGSYVATSPGTDGVWLGRTRVEGTFELTGMEDVFWRHSRTTVAEKKITKFEHDALANAVEDRILMWSGPDLCRRPRFDVEFAGAALTAGEDGWIVAERSRLSGVQLVDGHVVAVRNRVGAVTTIRWEELEGVRLPVEYRTGEVVVLLDWARVDEKWFLPKRAEFRGNFGPEWGPEIIVFDVDGVR